jgi:TRAP-type uncharacterized transport system substrate-binding protein
MNSLRFAAEWGMGPAYVISGWLAAGLRQMDLIDGSMSIELTRGTLDNLHLLGQAKADVAVTVPPLNARLAREGKGPFTRPYGDIQAIGKLPHHTLLTFIVSANLEVKSIEDIPARRIPIRLGTRLEPYGSINYIATKILEHYGLTPRDLEAWGGRIVSTPPAFGSLEKMMSGEADVILHQAGEAIWSELARRKAVRFLPFSRDLLDTLTRDYYCTPGVIRKGQFQGVEEDVACLHWTDLIVVASERLPIDLGYGLAQVITEKKTQIEDLLYTPEHGKYSHLTSRVRPEDVFRNLAVPIHVGAAQWARQNTYL